MKYTEQPVQILIVDDTPDILKLLAQILGTKGYQVLQASNGKVALEIAARTEPNLILLDISMPEMDGYETCQQLKEMDALHEIPVIFLSGLDESFDKMKAFRLGGVDYITKPFHEEELLARVQTHLRLRELTERLEQQVQERTQELQQEVAERKQVEAGLKESQERYRTLFENANDGIFLMRREQIIECNPATEKIFGRAHDELIGLSPIDVSPSHQPDRQMSEEKAWGKINNVLAGSPQRFEWVHSRPDDTPFDAEVSLNRVHLNDEWLILAMIRDVSERKQAEESLQHYAERLEILHEIDQAILAAQSAEAIAQAAMAHIRQLIPCQRAGVTLFDFATNQAVILAAHTDIETGFKKDTRFSLEPFANELKLLREGQVVVWGDPQLRGEDVQDIFTTERLGSTVSVPLITEGELIGTLNLNYEAAKPRIFTQEHETIARQIAAQLAIAIQQSRLQEQLQQHTEGLEHLVADRTRELSVLYEVTAIANEGQDLPTILARSLEKIVVALSSSAGIIHLLDDANRAGEERRLNLVVQQGLPVEIVSQIESLPADKGLGGYIIEQNEPLIVADVVSDPRAPKTSYIGGPYMYMGMPMRAGGRVVGVLAIFREETLPQFNVEEITLLTSIANQMGVVVESVRLREQAEHAVVMEERARLARELHDSVTQLLYSMNLFAKSGQNAYRSGDHDELKYCLTELGDNAQQALKEMRLLVYELRPPILEQDGLVGALQNRLDAVEGRAGINTQLLTDTTIEMPQEIEEGLYHITLEALNNSLKHAQASKVIVRIDWVNEQINLEITDNGSGFDPEATKDSGGLGLHSMRERAENLGGVFSLSSVPGQGTTVYVRVDLEETIAE